MTEPTMGVCAVVTAENPEESAAGVISGLSELPLGLRQGFHHARHHRAIRGGHLCDGHLAARVIEDRRALDLGQRARTGRSVLRYES